MFRSLLLSLMLCACSAWAGSGHMSLPPTKTTEACQARLSVDGRVVAHIRWELKLSKAEAHEQFTPPPDLPQWFVDTVHDWIESAYGWEGKPVKWFEKEWDACQGSDS